MKTDVSPIQKTRKSRITPTEKWNARIKELQGELWEEKNDAERFALICAIVCLPLECQVALITKGRTSTNFWIRNLCEKIVIAPVEPMDLASAEKLLFESNTPYYERVYRELVLSK